METTEKKELDLELQHARAALREDAAQIERKIEEAREAISPSRMFARHPMLTVAAAFLAGAVIGYWRPSVSKAAKPAIEAAKPIAKSGLEAAAEELPAAGAGAGVHLAQAAVA